MNSKLYTALFLIIIIQFTGNSSENIYTGKWKTIDDITGKIEAEVEVWIENNELKGQVVTVFNDSGIDSAVLCTKCSGELKNKPITGMKIMWGFSKKDNKWIDGKILDPANGKIYNCTLELQTKDKLKVFGYIDIIVKIGRSQVWHR